MTAAQSNHKAHNFIWQHTVGAFFFGVPNMGLNHENLLSVVENQRNCRLVRDLMQGSEVLQLLNQNFTSVWRGKPSEFSAVSFYETKDTPSVIVRYITLHVAFEGLQKTDVKIGDCR